MNLKSQGINVNPDGYASLLFQVYYRNSLHTANDIVQKNLVARAFRIINSPQVSPSTRASKSLTLTELQLQECSELLHRGLVEEALTLLPSIEIQLDGAGPLECIEGDPDLKENMRLARRSGAILHAKALLARNRPTQALDTLRHWAYSQDNEDIEVLLLWLECNVHEAKNFPEMMRCISLLGDSLLHCTKAEVSICTSNWLCGLQLVLSTQSLVHLPEEFAAVFRDVLMQIVNHVSCCALVATLDTLLSHHEVGADLALDVLSSDAFQAALSHNNKGRIYDLLWKHAKVQYSRKECQPASQLLKAAHHFASTEDKGRTCRSIAACYYQQGDTDACKEWMLLARQDGHEMQFLPLLLQLEECLQQYEDKLVMSEVSGIFNELTESKDASLLFPIVYGMAVRTRNPRIVRECSGAIISSFLRTKELSGFTADQASCLILQHIAALCNSGNAKDVSLLARVLTQAAHTCIQEESLPTLVTLGYNAALKALSACEYKVCVDIVTSTSLVLERLENGHESVSKPSLLLIGAEALLELGGSSGHLADKLLAKAKELMRPGMQACEHLHAILTLSSAAAANAPSGFIQAFVGCQPLHLSEYGATILLQSALTVFKTNERVHCAVLPLLVQWIQVTPSTNAWHRFIPGMSQLTASNQARMHMFYAASKKLQYTVEDDILVQWLVPTLYNMAITGAESDDSLFVSACFYLAKTLNAGKNLLSQERLSTMHQEICDADLADYWNSLRKEEEGSGGPPPETVMAIGQEEASGVVHSIQGPILMIPLLNAREADDENVEEEEEEEESSSQEDAHMEENAGTQSMWLQMIHLAQDN